MEPHMQEGAEPSRLRQFINIMAKGSLTVLVLGVIIGTFMMARIDRMVDQLELKSYDLRAQMQWGDPMKHPSPEVMILQFDDLSLNVLNDEFGVWPWPRDVHARMIHFLNKAGVRSLLYDIMFVAHRKGGEAADESLVNAFRQYKNVYLSMNFDNELTQSQKLGKDLTPQDIDMLKPLSIKLKQELDQAPKNTTLKLQKFQDGSVFFDNDHMTFDHFRSIMPSLLATGRNIGIINHGSDEDGISRSNPLFFRFRYQPFIKSKALPYTQKDGFWVDAAGKRVDHQGYLVEKSDYLPVVKKTDKTYVDQNPNYPRPVDAHGYLMDGYGHYVYLREKNYQFMYFPYLGTRAVLDLKYPNATPEITLTKEGHLKFKDYDIPLTNNGDFLVNWYNVNVKREELSHSLLEYASLKKLLVEESDKYETKLKNMPAGSSERKKAQAERAQNLDDIQKVESFLHTTENILHMMKYTPQPYKTVSAWEVIRVMKKEEAGVPLNQEDEKLKKLLKDKIIFVGATAVGAYDIKNTSIHATMPGVVLQANLFDNLYQNDGRYIHRVQPYINFTATLLICLLAAGCTFKMRSPLAGLLTTANVAVLYVLLAIILYQTQQLWINVAMPMVCLIITTTITFMLKYFFRNKDYEKTYALATTDSMTGLYNHRFFQEHMRRSIEQANRFKHKYSLLLIDIDFFKKFNDTYGHQAGDEVLRQVAKKLKKNVRTVDVVARYGGEEMAIILDRANEEEALAVAQKIVRAVAEEAYPIAEGVAKHVTISCGVATFPTHGETPSQLIEFSDAGLYRAKESGRNQVGAQYDHQPPDGTDQPEHHHEIQAGDPPAEDHGQDSHHAA